MHPQRSSSTPCASSTATIPPAHDRRVHPACPATRSETGWRTLAPSLAKPLQAAQIFTRKSAEHVASCSSCGWKLVA
eukprot:scaffold105082_cov30-Tisochrysis_lutea.AAC.3